MNDKLSTESIKRVAKEAEIDENFLLAVHEIADCFGCLYQMTFYPSKLDTALIDAKQKEKGKTMMKNRIKNKQQALEEATLTSVKNDYDRVKRLMMIENVTESPTNWNEIQLFLAPTNLQKQEKP